MLTRRDFLQRTALTTAANHTLATGEFKASSTGKAADSNDHILYNTTTGALYYDSDGNGPHAAVEFAVEVGAPFDAEAWSLRAWWQCRGPEAHNPVSVDRIRDVGVPVALLVVVGIVVAFLLPNAPGYAGSVQLAFVMSLGASGVTAVSGSTVANCRIPACARRRS